MRGFFLALSMFYRSTFGKKILLKVFSTILFLCVLSCAADFTILTELELLLLRCCGCNPLWEQPIKRHVSLLMCHPDLHFNILMLSGRMATVLLRFTFCAVYSLVFCLLMSNVVHHPSMHAENLHNTKYSGDGKSSTSACFSKHSLTLINS